MNESIFGNEYAPPIKAKRKKYKVGQGYTQKWGEAVVIDTFDNEGGQSLRQQGTATSNDTTDFIINVPKIVRNRAIVEGGKVMLSIPDGTAVGGNMRGIDSIDLQVMRVLATQVASGEDSIVIGNRNIANGPKSITIGRENSANGSTSSVAMGYINAVSNDGTAVGYNNTVSSNSGTAIGSSNISQTNDQITTIGYNNNASGTGSTAVGTSNIASGNYSTAIGASNSTNAKIFAQAKGYASRAENPGDEVVNISGTNTVPNVAKYVNNGYYKITANATPVEATLHNQASARYTIPASKAVNFKLMGVAMDSAFNTKSWEITGTIKRNATNTTSLVGSVTKTVIGADASTTSWDITVTADDTNDALSVFVTGDATLATRFAIKLETVEVGF